MDINLVLLKKSGLQKVFPLPSAVTVIGRRRDCDLRIPLASVSKRHCQLSHSDGKLKLRDLDSRNGTSHNGKAVKEAEVAAGDSLEVGQLKFIFQINGKPEKIADPSSQPEEMGDTKKMDNIDDGDGESEDRFDELMEQRDSPVNKAEEEPANEPADMDDTTEEDLELDLDQFGDLDDMEDFEPL